MTSDDSQATTGDDALDLKMLQAENDALKQEIEDLSKQLLEKQEEAPENLKELAARAQADLQNAKERLEREAQELRQFALEGMLRKLLPTIDNFQRAFEHLPDDLDDHDWVSGVRAVQQELDQLVAESGLEKIESLGQDVDPERHEVLQQGPGEAGKIVQVFEEGYVLNGKVIRPAKVVVGIGG